ncbi:MAG: NAD-glutamate dehydrogenase domain-containing protein, partial [Alphaproteobacteria bacterium]
MTAPTTSLKHDAIDAVVGMARRRLTGARADAAAEFIQHYYSDIAAEDIVGADPDDLYGAVLSLWQFGATRKPGAAKVRVFNPRVEKDGWHCAHTIVEVIHDDIPFLVDSVTMELNRRDMTVHLVVHPQFSTGRDAGGKRVAIAPRGNGQEGAVVESFMHLEVDEQTSPEVLRDIETGLAGVLGDVRSAVAGWRPMRARAKELLDELKTTPPKLPQEEIDEAGSFLRWLLDDHYTFLGYREMVLEGDGRRTRIKVLEDTCVGLLADPEISVFQGLRKLGHLPDEVLSFLREPRAVVIAKTNRRSTVHRPVFMDAVAVKKFDASGAVTGMRLFVGLFTSSAYDQTPRSIPLLRRKVADMMDRAGYDPKSHAGKSLLHILDTFPRDELFQISADDLFEISRGIVQLQERQRIALFLRRDPFERFISAYVYVPRERYTTAIREDFERILCAAFDGVIAGRYTHMSDDVLSRLRFIVNTTPGSIPDYDVKEVEARLVEAGRSWGDRLKQALVEEMGEEKGLARYNRYENAFPVNYTETFSAHAAVYDIVCIDGALDSGVLGANLYHPIEAGDDEFRFKIYNPAERVPLSDILPMLENMGFKVIGDVPYDVTPAGEGETVAIHDFELASMDGAAVDFDAVRDSFHEAFGRIWSGEMESDGFNRLVISAGLGWRQIVVLRAYCKFLRQAAIPFSQRYMQATLANNGAIAALLVELFERRFDPDLDAGREAQEARLADEISRRLGAVENLDEDRIIRRFLNLVQTTLRTSFYQMGDDGAPRDRLSFKFDAGNVDELPEPRHRYEIFVYSPRMEGLHMRFGPIARGGLRWSD